MRPTLSLYLYHKEIYLSIIRILFYKMANIILEKPKCDHHVYKIILLESRDWDKKKKKRHGNETNEIRDGNNHSIFLCR